MPSSGFLGSYADLSGFRVGRFYIEGLVARDASGAPLWRIICQHCHYPQMLRHARLAPLVQGRNTQTTLQCANSACPLSRHSETIDEFRRRERREAEQAANAATEAQQAAEAKAAKEQAQAARSAEVQRQYIQYVNHQWLAGQEDAKICTRQRWFELTDGTRRTVLDLIEKDPTLRISGL